MPNKRLYRYYESGKNTSALFVAPNEKSAKATASSRKFFLMGELGKLTAFKAEIENLGFKNINYQKTVSDIYRSHLMAMDETELRKWITLD